MEVHYRDTIEKPNFFRDVGDYFHYLLSSKAKDWRHEQEVRLLLIDPKPARDNSTPFYVPMGLPYRPQKKEIIDWKEVRAYPHLGSECYESLYLGIKMDEKEKFQIIEEARKCNPNIKIYQMTVDPEAFKFKAELLDH